MDSYSDEALTKEYTIDALTVFYKTDGTIDLDQTQNSFVPGADFPAGTQITEVGPDKVVIKGSQDFELILSVKPDPVVDPATGEITGYHDVNCIPNDASGAPASLKVDLTGIGAMDTQIGANEGQQLEIRIPTISLSHLGIEKTEVTTQDSSGDAITEIKGAVKYVSDARSRLGAYQNRLEHTISSLDITNENMTASYSRIMDVDMAEEMTNYTTEQVISQASTSMLAQANERPSQVLQLLQ